MSNKFEVAVSYHDILGYITYDEETKKVEVVLPQEAARSGLSAEEIEAAEKAQQAAYAFLTTAHEINIPHDTLRDFTKTRIEPTADVKSFQIVLTRLWEETEVHVDWSRPVDYVKTHPLITD